MGLRVGINLFNVTPQHICGQLVSVFTHKEFRTLFISVPRSKNEPTTAAKKTEAATQKSQFLKFGLTQRYEMLHNIA